MKNNAYELLVVILDTVVDTSHVCDSQIKDERSTALTYFKTSVSLYVCCLTLLLRNTVTLPHKCAYQ